MKMIAKRWGVLALCLIFIVSICGCSAAQSPEETTLAPVETTLAVQETTAAETTAAEETTVPETTAAEPETTAHVHAYEETVTAADCTTGGYTTYTCTCGETYVGNETSPLGHSYVAKVHTPTDGSTQGYTEYTCTRCGLSYKDEYTVQPGADASFFNDAAFIGDSVTLKLRNYHMSTGALGNATFLCVGSYSVNNAVTNQLYLSYQGQDMTPQDALAACGAKKVFILLGMNDIALFGENSINMAMTNWATMIANIRSKCPDIQIYIQSGTPIYTGGEVGGLNNNRMDQYNVSLKAFAESNGCYYIDIATPMKDSTNGLAERYCSDNYVHFTDAACKLWVDLLMAYVSE